MARESFDEWNFPRGRRVIRPKGMAIRTSRADRPSQRPAGRIWSTGCSPPRPDVAWCGDMTEIVTGEDKLYLATVTDLYSRRILGFAMGAQHDAHWSSPR
jgi:transposase InsO family protein